METVYVYVLDKEGKPLMPTTRYRKVRRMLREKRAVVKNTTPFTIQLLYEPDTRVTQRLVYGCDPGRTNIGAAVVREDGACVYQAQCVTRNKEVPKLMRNRRVHRSASRRGERLRRKRRAASNGTVRSLDIRQTRMGRRPVNMDLQGGFPRILPGYEKPVRPKLIRNTEARFNNRKRPAGWLTPTATQLLRTHLNLLKKVCKILPVTDVVFEANRFAFMALENPGIHKWEYQKGPLYGKGGLRQAVSIAQGGMCLLCGKKPIDSYHHIIPLTKGGSDTVGNIAGLCDDCHYEKVHKYASWVEKLRKRKAGLNKKYGALSVLNQIIPSLARGYAELFPDHTFAVESWTTKQVREAHRFHKDHSIDAACIALSIMEDVSQVDLVCERHEIRQFRRHDRARIKSQRGRYYYLGKEKVAVNRRKAVIADPVTGKEKEQAKDSLEDWYRKTVNLHGEKEARRQRSQLRVKKSIRIYNNMDRLLPGSVLEHEGKRHIISANHGTSYQTCDGHEFPKSRCRIVWKNEGLVYLC